MDFSTIYSLMLEISEGVSKKFSVNKTLLAQMGTAICFQESKFNPNAVPKTKSGKVISSAKGLMQVLNGTKVEVEKKYMKVEPAPLEKMFDPRYNITVGLHYLAYQLKRYKGDVDKAIHAYNQGSYPGVNKADGESYRNLVRSHYNKFFNKPILAYNNNGGGEWP